MFRDLVDMTQRPIWNQQVVGAMGQTINMEAVNSAIVTVVRGFLPHVCNKQIFDFKHRVQNTPESDKLSVHAKWTFFNDIDVRLELHITDIIDRPLQLEEIRRRLKPSVDDFEAWQADAIMKCEAGEDVWERPKSDPFSGLASQAQSASQLGHQARAQQGALSSGLANGGLANGVFGQAGVFGKS